ncbi:hypothetical protein ACHQM5_023672 [Ranunculus cassubicifolius]
MELKRELVHEIVRLSKEASTILLSWRCQDLVELLSAESGIERRYQGVTKSILIDHLLKLISRNQKDSAEAKTQIGSKRQRKKEYPAQLANDHSDNTYPENHGNEQRRTLICQNLACKATLTPECRFCKRCSCCICLHYDDNKDPTMWLTCESDSLNYQDDACGMSCHLKCALKHGKAGIGRNGCYKNSDGCFICVSCGKVNSIMRSWRKQMMVAKDARRVSVLCERVFLSHKMLEGTEKYIELKHIVDTIVQKLNSELGFIDQVSSEMVRGLVSRLSCGAQVQQLCSSAIEAVNLSQPYPFLHQIENEGQPSCRIRFEEVSPVSVVLVLEFEDKLLLAFLGCRIWHCKSTAMDYPEKPTYIVLRPDKRFVITDLDPSTKYVFKVSVFSSSNELGVWESTCTTQAPPQSSHDDSHKDSTNSSDEKLDTFKVRLLDDISKNDNKVGSTAVPPSTPCKSDGTQEDPSSTAKKDSSESNYEYCVRVIKWLEREGYMEKDFRVKFLSWFSLKSSMRDRRVVSAFVDNLIDDPTSLSDQLVDTFTDEIDSPKKPTRSFNFCSSLWH